MSKTRMEAFSDGVFAILITIMVLELKIPHDTDVAGLVPLLPKFACYVLSFVYLGIYWNNHHHLLQAAECVNGRILWANLHLLFWLSLIPFATGWMGEHSFPLWPIALYGAVLFCCGMAYYLLSRSLIKQHGVHSGLARAIGGDFKGVCSLVLYAAAVALAFAVPWASLAIYVFVALMWLIPDRRIERALEVERCGPEEKS